ncbi:MAG: hypothetical protein WD013_04710, partial [Gemmatimonadota bacterium]
AGVPPLLASPPPAEPQTIFDREFLFLSTGPGSEPSKPDSLVVLPWLFRARAASDQVRHTQAVWFSRGTTWEALAADSVAVPPSRTPWRIVPGERIRIVVGSGDRIQSLVFRAPPRELETTVGDLLAEWERPGGTSVGLYGASTVFPSGSVDGILLDLGRRWEPGAEPGDWLFVHNGGDFQLFIQEEPPLADPRDSAAYRGWTRVAFQDLPWDEIEMRWTELRPFESARRDIPRSWAFATPGGELSGVLQPLSTHLEAGNGEGPILPVRGFFTVEGTVQVEGEEFEVVGLVRHVQR